MVEADFLDKVAAWLRLRWDQENRIHFYFNGRNAADEIEEITEEVRDMYRKRIEHGEAL